MGTSQNKNRFGFKLSRVIFFRFLFLVALTVSILVQYSTADADGSTQAHSQSSTDEESPMTSDDYDPVDYLPPGLPPSKNDPAIDIKS